MGFKLHIDNGSYSLVEFLLSDRSEAHLTGVKQFLTRWVKEEEFIFYTSGSTGTPKKLIFTKQQLVKSALLTSESLGLDVQPQHIFMCLNPGFVAGAMMIARALVWDCSLTIVAPAGDVLERMQTDHPYTFASFVPLQLRNLDKHKSKLQGIKHILIGGATIPPAVESWFEHNHEHAFHTYGMTETLTHVGLRRPGEEWYTPVKEYTIDINKEGRILIKGGILAGQLVTNDIGVNDTSGRFKVEGRADFVINSGGIKVFPEQLELMLGSNLNTLDGFEFCIGYRKHEELGQALVFVSNDFIDFALREKLAEALKQKGNKFMIPKFYLQINALPRLENGKIDRKKLNEWIDNQDIY